jgi:hypothetical protein
MANGTAPIYLDEHGNPIGIKAAPTYLDEQGNPIKPAGATTVNAPDGKIINFPASMSKEDIEGAMQKLYPPTLAAQSKSGLTPSTIGPRPKGVASWLESLESDIRSGSGVTVPGRLLQKMGAPGLEKGGGSKDAAEFMASPLLGTVHAAQGLSMTPSHPWEGTKRAVGGALEAATIPGLIEFAPSEAGANFMAKTEEAVKGGAKSAFRFAKDVAKSPITKLEEEHAAQAKQVEEGFQNELAAHRENVQAIKAENAQAMTKFNDANQLRSHEQRLASTVGDNLKLTDKRIAQKVGGRFNSVSDAIEKTGTRVKITDAEREARGKLFFPDSVQAFDNLMGNVKTNLGVGDFGVLRRTYTKLNDVLYGSRELPTDLYDAVKTVRDSLGSDLQKAATTAGKGDQYKQALKAWAQYQEDWHGTKAVAKGGSPLAKVLQAEDPQYVIDQLKGKSGERLVRMLGNYGEYGADSGLAQRLKNFSARLETIPSSKIPPTPKNIPAPPSRPPIQQFDRAAASRQLLVDSIRKAIKLGLIGAGGAYGYEKLFGGGRGGSAVP